VGAPDCDGADTEAVIVACRRAIRLVAATVLAAAVCNWTSATRGPVNADQAAPPRLRTPSTVRTRNTDN
jgi:hypothetical protein